MQAVGGEPAFLPAPLYRFAPVDLSPSFTERQGPLQTFQHLPFDPLH
jgi:hypothetical protein